MRDRTRFATHIINGILDYTIYDYTNPQTGNKYQPADVVLLSDLRILVIVDNRFPYPDERGPNIEFAYDLLATPPGMVEAKFLYGKFIVRGTVTY
jgi:hypothetical protein